MNLPNTTIKVASTLGRIRILSLDAETRPATMEIMLRDDDDCQCADIMVFDKTGRKFGIQIGNQSLIELQRFLNSHIRPI